MSKPKNKKKTSYKKEINLFKNQKNGKISDINENQKLKNTLKSKDK